MYGAWALAIGLGSGFLPPSRLVAEELREIPLGKLPQPSGAVAELIDSARVTFETGPRDLDDTDEDNRITGETHYRIAYDYRTRARWTVQGRGAQRRVVIRVAYRPVRWQPSHRIWLQREPPPETFWSDPLVQHELDHVRISNDPKLATRFEERLRETSVLRQSVGTQVVVDAAQVDRWIDTHVHAIFEEISQLVEIRYRELDRLTRHGRDPLPFDSPLRPRSRSAADSPGSAAGSHEPSSETPPR